jgi:hypothetical protein
MSSYVRCRICGGPLPAGAAGRVHPQCDPEPAAAAAASFASIACGDAHNVYVEAIPCAAVGGQPDHGMGAGCGHRRVVYSAAPRAAHHPPRRRAAHPLNDAAG